MKGVIFDAEFVGAKIANFLLRDVASTRDCIGPTGSQS